MVQDREELSKQAVATSKSRCEIENAASVRPVCPTAVERGHLPSRKSPARFLRCSNLKVALDCRRRARSQLRELFCGCVCMRWRLFYTFQRIPPLAVVFHILFFDRRDWLNTLHRQLQGEKCEEQRPDVPLTRLTTEKYPPSKPGSKELHSRGSTVLLCPRRLPTGNSCSWGSNTAHSP